MIIVCLYLVLVAFVEFLEIFQKSLGGFEGSPGNV